MTVSIIIPNYNGADLLEKNLPQVCAAASWYEKHSGHTVEVVVTDDASSDASSEIVTKLALPIRYLEHGENGGFSTNVERGVKASTGEILVLLNTDVSPDKEFLKPLLTHFTDPTVFAVGCVDRSIENGKEILRGNGTGRWEKGFLLHKAGNVTSQKTLWASGGSSAFSRKIWREIHGLYPIYNPFYWEDIDLSYRAQKAGYLVLFDPKSFVTHVHEEGSIKQQFSHERITSVAYRNQFFFVWLNITDINRVLSHLIWLPYHTLTALLRGDSAYLSGLVAAVVKLPEVLRLRRKNRILFTKTDRDIIR